MSSRTAQSPADPTAPHQASQQATATRASVLAELPGTDVVETATVIRGELGAPHRSVLPILPARSDIALTIPRSVGVLSELWCDLQPHGWRLTRHQGRESKAAESLLASDVNALADVVGAEKDGDRGPVTVQLLGPWSLSAGLHLHNGEKVLQDLGARRDVAESLADGLGDHVASVQQSLDGRPVVVRLDERDLQRVLAGEIPTASGYRTLRAVPRPEALQTLTNLAEAARHAGAAAVELVLPVGADPRDFLERGFDTLVLDRPGRAPREWEPVAAVVESGVRLGVLIPELARPLTVGGLVETIVRPWTEIGLSAALLSEQMVLPGRELAQTNPGAVRRALTRVTDLAHGLQQTALET